MASILIVDDQADIRRVLTRLVRLAGHDALDLPGGPEALAHLARHVPDLILLDVMMPDVDGFDVLRAVRADPRTARVPVVMFSAVSAEEMIERARAEGANDYWIKGAISAESLCAGIAEHLARADRSSSDSGRGGGSLAADGLNSAAPV
jgi:CheY-like chemotaxis protein